MSVLNLYIVCDLNSLDIDKPTAITEQIVPCFIEFSRILSGQLKIGIAEKLLHALVIMINKKGNQRPGFPFHIMLVNCCI